MREGALRPDFVSSVSVGGVPDRGDLSSRAGSMYPAPAWDPERFTREQIQSLVRQVFSSTNERVVQQVVFSALGRQNGVDDLCLRVGETLSRERLGDVVVVGRAAVSEKKRSAATGSWNRKTRSKDHAVRIQENLWSASLPENSEGYASSSLLHSYLGDIRAEFEYSIVVGPPADESGEAIAMAEFADGLILVLSAKNTRRATAARIKRVLERSRVRLLGTVLGDREFPIPDILYRRL